MSTPTTPFYPMTHDDAQELIAAIGDNSKLAEAYDATRTYTVDEHCIHSGKLYRCKTAITTAEGWTPAHWEEITVGEELTENSKGLAKLIPVISGSLNNSGYTIATGEYFEANGELYKATAAIPVGQSWSNSASSVSGSALNDAVGSLNSKFTRKEYQFVNLAFDAGTVGTRGLQTSVNITDDINTYGTLISLLITLVSDSSKSHFQVFRYGNTIVLNGYRATDAAMTNNSVFVIATYMKG